MPLQRIAKDEWDRREPEREKVRANTACRELGKNSEQSKEQDE